MPTIAIVRYTSPGEDGATFMGYLASLRSPNHNPEQYSLWPVRTAIEPQFKLAAMVNEHGSWPRIFFGRALNKTRRGGLSLVDGLVAFLSGKLHRLRRASAEISLHGNFPKRWVVHRQAGGVSARRSRSSARHRIGIGLLGELVGGVQQGIDDEPKILAILRRAEVLLDQRIQFASESALHGDPPSATCVGREQAIRAVMPSLDLAQGDRSD